MITIDKLELNLELNYILPDTLTIITGYVSKICIDENQNNTYFILKDKTNNIIQIKVNFNNFINCYYTIETAKIALNTYKKQLSAMDEINKPINQNKKQIEVIILERISTESLDKFDNKVANFINNHDVVNMYYATSQYKDGSIHYSVMITYYV